MEFKSLRFRTIKLLFFTLFILSLGLAIEVYSNSISLTRSMCIISLKFIRSLLIIGIYELFPWLVIHIFMVKSEVVIHLLLLLLHRVIHGNLITHSSHHLGHHNGIEHGIVKSVSVLLHDLVLHGQREGSWCLHIIWLSHINRVDWSLACLCIINGILFACVIL